MSYPIIIPQIGHDLAQRIDDEIARARKKFPQPNALLAALTEEVGEVAEALMDKSWDEVTKECVQVCAMAIRIIHEGDPTLNETRAKRGAGPSPNGMDTKGSVEYQVYHAKVVEACVARMGEKNRNIFNQECDYIEEFMRNDDPDEVAIAQQEALS